MSLWRPVKAAFLMALLILQVGGRTGAPVCEMAPHSELPAAGLAGPGHDPRPDAAPAPTDQSDCDHPSAPDGTPVRLDCGQPAGCGSAVLAFSATDRVVSRAGAQQTPELATGHLITRTLSPDIPPPKS